MCLIAGVRFVQRLDPERLALLPPVHVEFFSRLVRFADSLRSG